MQSASRSMPTAIFWTKLSSGFWRSEKRESPKSKVQGPRSKAAVTHSTLSSASEPNWNMRLPSRLRAWHWIRISSALRMRSRSSAPIQLDVLRVCSPPSNSSFTSPQNFSVSEADRGRVAQSPEEERQIQKPETRPHHSSPLVFVVILDLQMSKF